MNFGCVLQNHFLSHKNVKKIQAHVRTTRDIIFRQGSEPMCPYKSVKNVQNRVICPPRPTHGTPVPLVITMAPRYHGYHNHGCDRELGLIPGVWARPTNPPGSLKASRAAEHHLWVWGRGGRSPAVDKKRDFWSFEKMFLIKIARFRKNERSLFHLKKKKGEECSSLLKLKEN